MIKWLLKYKGIVAGVAAFAILSIAYHQVKSGWILHGRQIEQSICQAEKDKAAQDNIDIRKKQNEERNRRIDPDALIDILHTGQF